MKKITARISLFVIFIISLPAIISGYLAVENYKESRKPIAFESNGFYFVCDGGCSSYEKQIIDNPEPYEQVFRNDYFRKLDLASSLSESARKTAYFYTFLFFGCATSVLIFWLINKITFDGETIIVKTTRFQAQGVSIPQPLQKGSFSINEIEGIKIIRTTPFGPEVPDISRVNWRDRVKIILSPTGGLQREVKIDLYLFPRFREVLTEIVKKRPDIKVVFSKSTISENLRETE